MCKNLFYKGGSHFRFLLLDDAVELLHCFYKAAGLENVEKVVGKSGDRVCLAIIFDGLADIDGNLVAFLYVFTEGIVLNKEKAVVDGVAEEDPRVGTGNDGAHAESLDDFGRLLAGGAAAEGAMSFTVLSARYSVGMMISVSMSSPRSQTLPVNCSMIIPLYK